MSETRRLPSAKVPRGQARRRELLEEAARILLRDGLECASMDLIAVEAGASKATLYRHFGDRNGLLAEVVRYLCDDFIADVDRATGVEVDLQAGLAAVLMQLVHVLGKPNHPAFFRLIVAGSQRDSAIGKTWYEYGPLVWHGMLTRVFEAQRSAGRLPDDADWTGYPEMLFDAVFSDMVVRTALLGDDVRATPLHERHVDRIVMTVVSALESVRPGRD